MKAREYIEHQYLPWILFLDRYDTLKHITEGKESYLYELYNHISKEFKALERYELFMFRVIMKKQMLPIGLVNLIIIKTPEVLIPGDSAYLFIVHSENELIYYTVDFVMDITFSIKKYHNKTQTVIANCELDVDDIINKISMDLLH